MKSLHNEAFLKEFNKLNDAQKSAVEKLEGPVLVIAGPGTGKTQILSARIGNILQKTDTNPHNILCLTYTDAGTIAMRERLLRFIGPEAYNVHIFTFHAFANNVIQENLDYFGIRDLQPLSDLESIEIYQKLINNLPSDHLLKRLTGDPYYELSHFRHLFEVMKREDWSTDFICDAIDQYLEDLPHREEYQYKQNRGDNKKGDLKEKLFLSEKEKMEKLRKACSEFKNFEKLLKDASRYDFQDMILWVVNAFKKNESLLRNYQEQYHYILVDEFQDTNGAQNELLTLLTSYWDVPNIFVVGDDDQAIYRFQGANVTNIIDFHHHYREDLHIEVLTENYRSTQQILDASKAVIDHNSERLVNNLQGLSKELKARGTFTGSAVDPQIIEYDNVVQEEAALVEKLLQIEKSGENLSEVAVIYRYHQQVDNLINILEKENVPLNVKKRVNILELPLVDNILTLLSYINEEFKKPHSQEHLLFQIMHYEWFGISPRDNARISTYCRRERNPTFREVISSDHKLLQLGLESIGQIRKFEKNLVTWISKLPNMTIQGLLEKILTHGNVLKWIMNSEERSWNMQVITTFFDFIKEEMAKTPTLTLEGFLETVSRMRANRVSLGINKVISAENGINFITAHSSKGLEFKYVFMVGCVRDQWEKKRGNKYQYKFPDTLIASSDGDKDEEERRLFYVAMTRSKQYLQISYHTKNAKGKDQEKSRFIAELEEGARIPAKRQAIPEEKLLQYNFNLLYSPGKPAVELLDHNLIERSLKNFRMSTTSLNKYLKCPLTFYFENIIMVPQARNVHMGFGIAVHQALEMYFKEMLKKKAFPESARLVELFKDGMQYCRSHFTKLEYENRLEYGQQVLPQYCDTYLEKWNKVVILEYDIKHAQVNGVPVTGKLDKIEFDGKQVNVVDYKTGKHSNGKKKLKAPSEKEPLGGDYWRQIIFYKILMDNDTRKNWEMVSGEMDFVQPEKDQFHREKVVVRPDHIELVKNQIRETYDKILNHEFSEGCGEDDCQWCNFVRHNYRSDDLMLAEQEE